jgi:hypothetical protein
MHRVWVVVRQEGVLQQTRCVRSVYLKQISEDMRDRFVGLATRDDIELSSSSQLTLDDVVNKQSFECPFIKCHKPAVLVMIHCWYFVLMSFLGSSAGYMRTFLCQMEVLKASPIFPR